MRACIDYCLRRSERPSRIASQNFFRFSVAPCGPYCRSDSHAARLMLLFPLLLMAKHELEHLQSTMRHPALSLLPSPRWPQIRSSVAAQNLIPESLTSFVPVTDLFRPCTIASSYFRSPSLLPLPHHPSHHPRRLHKRASATALKRIHHCPPPSLPSCALRSNLDPEPW